MTTRLGVSRIPVHALEWLLQRVEQGRLVCPFSAIDLADAGFHGHALDVVEALADLDRVAAIAALRVAIAERVHRPPPRLELVWTGPETRSSTARSTALVVEQLFEDAHRSIIVAGYNFDSPDILEPLHRGMKERALAVALFLDIVGEPSASDSADAFASSFIDRFFVDVWNFGPPHPDVFYDPRTAMRGPPWVSLHAKCVIADDERTLITSANFTERGQTRNIETGVLITDKAFSESLAAHWRQLVREGLVKKYTG